jgi:Bacterial protein of unknown function (DUF903)
MRKVIPLTALGLALSLCGCATHYVMRLENGTQLTTAGKPKLKGATYYYKTGRGQTVAIPQARVLEIEPASMVSSDKPFPTTQPKTKHWWHFW